MSMKTIIPSVLIGMLLLFQTNCSNKRYEHGEILYQNFCANCHMEDGTGLVGNIPPLAGADYLAKEREKLACIIRYGIKEEIVVNGRRYTQAMEGIEQLSEAEITNVINYINTAWGNDLPFMPITEVQESLKNCRLK